MRKTLALALVPWLAALTAACASPVNDVQRGRQAAQDFNQDARIGRADTALERVAPALRDDFAAHHKGWGSDIRIADMEVAGVKAHGPHELDVMVRFSWFRVVEQELRVTTLKQAWREHDGWELVGEERLDGAVGLLGEAVPAEAAPAEPHPPAHFPTVRIGSAGNAAE
jgi:hypothetical protein